jgi:hypothetical protein
MTSRAPRPPPLTNWQAAPPAATFGRARSGAVARFEEIVRGPGGLASGLLHPGPTYTTDAMRPLISLMRAAIPLAALLVAAGAGAQATSITLDVNTKTTQLLKKTDCNLPLTINWTLPATGSSACTSDHADLVIWVTKATSCGTDPAAGDFTVGTVPQATWSSTGTGNFPLKVTDLPVFAGATCPLADQEVDMKVCAYAKYLPLGAFTCVEARPATVPTITYDSKPPERPTIDSVVPQDSALLVYFTAATGSASVTARYGPTVDSLIDTQPVDASAGSLRIGGLTNDTTYGVFVYALDDAGNRSIDSEPGHGTPVKSYGFFDDYTSAGGATEGCAAAPAGALPLLGLGWLSRRRRRPSRGGARS